MREITGESVTTYCVPEGHILSFIKDGVTYQLHADALGNSRLITDENGDIAARYEFDAWGRAISVTEDSELAGFPYRFLGSLGVRWDATLGMYYMRQRWYDPTLQRFISRDPIGLKGGTNLYCYSSNQPVTLSDPSGKVPWPPNEQKTIYDAIDVIRRIDRRAGRELDSLMALGKIRPLTGLAAYFTEGFTPGGIIHFWPKDADCQSETCDFVHLISILYHEQSHISRNFENDLLKKTSILIYVGSLTFESTDLELDAYESQLLFLLRLRKRFPHWSNCINYEIKYVKERVENLREDGNIEGKEPRFPLG